MLGVFALSAALKETDLIKYQTSLSLLESAPIKLELAKNLEFSQEIFKNANYFTAGSIEERLSSLYDLKSSKLIALKGGYGVVQCLEELEISFFKGKSIFGYSDLTALFLKLEEDKSIKFFHSPMLVELESLSEDEFNSLKTFCNCSNEEANLKDLLLKLTVGLEQHLISSKSIFAKNPSYIWGGNLSMILAQNKIPSIEKGFKRILFIEDCYEEAYKVERMIYAAECKGLFKEIDELWLGESKEALFNYSLLEALAQKYGFNLVKDLPFGHSQKFTLPIFQYYLE